MGSKPILFSAPMVRAILAGTKTQTRRVVKHQPPPHTREARLVAVGVCFRPIHAGPSMSGDGGFHSLGERVPWKVGDTLWVKESWCKTGDRECVPCVAYSADGSGRRYLCDNEGEGDPVALGESCNPILLAGVKWKPSMFMPRWASRITLLVKSVRVERLNTISDGDIEAEGVSYFQRNIKPGQEKRVTRIRAAQQFRGHPELCNNATFSRRAAFETLWDSINGKKHPWASNPFVWVVEFERIEAEAGGKA